MTVDISIDFELKDITIHSRTVTSDQITKLLESFIDHGWSMCFSFKDEEVNKRLRKT